MSSEYEGLLPPTWKKQLERWVQEDIPSFDVGGAVVGTSQAAAILYSKSECVVAGLPFVKYLFEYFDCQIEWFVNEGSHLNPDNNKFVKIEVARVTGRVCDLLKAERTSLNILSRCSSVALSARKISNVARMNHPDWKGKIAGTRKTTPGFRLIEKYGLLVGGADTHRYDLSSMVMLKDNHIDAVGSITGAVKKARDIGGFSVKIEVECRSEDDAVEACKAGADVVMLDNFESEKFKATAAIIKSAYPHIIIEGSGGLNISTVASYVSPDVDILSFGALTHGYPSVDFSLKITKQERL